MKPSVVLSPEQPAEGSNGDGGITFTKHIRSSRALMFRLLKNPILTDIVLVCGTQSLGAHRILLASCSPYLKEMLLREENNGGRSYRLVLPDIDAATAEIILEFAYTGRLNVSSKNLSAIGAVLEAAHQLQVGALYRRCSDLLVNTLTPTNVIDVWELGDRCGDSDLAHCSVELLARQLETRYRSKRYLGLPFTKFRSVMMCAAKDPGTPRAVDSLMRAAVAWVKHDRPTRADQLTTLLRCVQEVAQPMLPRGPNFIYTQGDAPRKQTKPPEMSTIIMTTTTAMPEKVPRLDQVSTEVPEDESKVLPGEEKSESTKETVICEESEIAPIMTPRTRLKSCPVVPLLVAVAITRYDNLLLEFFDPIHDQWIGWREEAVTIPYHRGAAYICLDNTVFFFGGETKTGDKVGVCSALHVFSRRFYSISSMKAVKAWAGAGLLEAMLYCVGGQGKYSLPLNDVERYCQTHNTWKSVSPLLKARCYAGVASAGGHLFALGGSDDVGWLQSCEMYDPEANEWTEVAPLPTDLCNCPLRTTVYEEMVHVIRGHRPKSVRHLDVDHATWVSDSHFSDQAPLRPQVAVVFGEQMYVLDERRHLYVYYLHNGMWEKLYGPPGPHGQLMFATLVLNDQPIVAIKDFSYQPYEKKHVRMEK